MPLRKDEPASDRLWAIALSCAAILVWLFLAAARPGLDRAWGDEGTYQAMISSLSEDGDLLFRKEDRARIPDDPTDGRASLILQSTSRGISYSKPVLYPLLAAPFYRVLGDVGPVVFNFLAMGLALFVAARSLLGDWGRQRTIWALCTWALTSAVLPYLLWRMGESLQVSLALAGMMLALRPSEDRPGRALVGAFLLGLVAALRYPNAALAAVPIAAAVLQRRPGRALRLATASLAAFLLVLGLGKALTGTHSPYSAQRATFDASSGYPDGPDHEHFYTGWATHGVPRLNLGASAYSAFYFLVGRHSGVLAYLPMLALLCFGILYRPDLPGLLLIAAGAVLVAFYLLWMPGNYFGGSTFVGNRYILPLYAAMLALPRRSPSRRALFSVWAVAAAVGISACVSAAGAEGEIDSQSHTRAGIFDFMPYESTARSIDGRTDRYWSGDLVRFTAPGAEVEPHSFVLPPDGRGVELMVATRRERSTLRFLVTSEAEEFQVELRDWVRERTDSVQDLKAGTAGLIDLRPAPAWRHHAYWWDPGERYRIWVFRLQVVDGTSPVRLRYLGDGAGLESGFEHEALGKGFEESPEAGGLSEVWIEVRNLSEETWSSEAVLPVVLGWRIFEADGTLLASEQLPLLHDVAPGESLRQSLSVTWPNTEGTYELEVDLVKDQVARFGDRARGPLASWQVELTLPDFARAAGF